MNNSLSFGEADAPPEEYTQPIKIKPEAELARIDPKNMTFDPEIFEAFNGANLKDIPEDELNRLWSTWYDEDV